MLYSIFGLFSIVALANGADWNYDQPEDWANAENSCGGVSQSPINIEVDSTIQGSGSMLFSLGLNDTETISCSGYSVVLEPSNEPTTLYFDEDGASVEWTLAQIHFHWGADDSEGSEHTVDGEAMPLEMHLVHWDKAVTEEFSYESLLVLGVFFEIGDHNDDLEYLIETFDQFQANDTSLSFEVNDSFDFLNLVPDDAGSDFYFYDGSLTTPTCDETVSWKVARSTLTVSADQMTRFREIQTVAFGAEEREDLSYNFRPVQRLNGRFVSRSFAFPESSVLAIVIVCWIMVISIGSLLIAAAIVEVFDRRAKAAKAAENAAKKAAYQANRA